MATHHFNHKTYLGAGEVKDRYYSPPQPLGWWDKPENISRVALAAILILLAIAITGNN